MESEHGKTKHAFQLGPSGGVLQIRDCQDGGTPKYVSSASPIWYNNVDTFSDIDICMSSNRESSTIGTAQSHKSQMLITSNVIARCYYCFVSHHIDSIKILKPQRSLCLHGIYIILT